MSTKRQLRLARTVLALFVLVFGGRSLIDWWGALDPWERSSLGLAVSSVVLLVWGVAMCLRERRLELERLARR